jgi:hypothetical protein
MMIMPTDADVQHQTITIETELFKRRLTALQEIVSLLMTDNGSHQLDSQTFQDELRSVEHMLNKLAENVAKDGSLNAGGKFEWMDSVLVKVCNGKQVGQFNYRITFKAYLHDSGTALCFHSVLA